jgi:hypothetical protein
MSSGERVEHATDTPEGSGADARVPVHQDELRVQDTVSGDVEARRWGGWRAPKRRRKTRSDA